MRCWSPGCPSASMSKWDERVCWIHAIRYVIRGEALPLSVVPLQAHVRGVMASRGWSSERMAEDAGISRRNLEKLLSQSKALGLVMAERWADRLRVHPFDIWGDAYFAQAVEVAA